MGLSVTLSVFLSLPLHQFVSPTIVQTTVNISPTITSVSWFATHWLNKTVLVREMKNGRQKVRWYNHYFAIAFETSVLAQYNQIDRFCTIFNEDFKKMVHCLCSVKIIILMRYSNLGHISYDQKALHAVSL